MRCYWPAVTSWQSQDHYRHGVPISDLFAHDLAACLPLPSIGFDPVRYEPRKADRRGYIQVEANTYAAGPSFHGRALTVGNRADTMEILDEDTTCWGRASGSGVLVIGSSALAGTMRPPNVTASVFMRSSIALVSASSTCGDINPATNCPSARHIGSGSDGDGAGTAFCSPDWLFETAAKINVAPTNTTASIPRSIRFRFGVLASSDGRALLNGSPPQAFRRYQT